MADDVIWYRDEISYYVYFVVINLSPINYLKKKLELFSNWSSLQMVAYSNTAIICQL